MDFGNVIHRSTDNSYIIKNGTYHVPPEGEWKELWAEVNEYVQNNPNKVTEEAPYIKTLEEAKLLKINEINILYESATSNIISSYPQAEVLTFNKQEQEAKAWLQDNSVETPLIDAIAKGRNVDKSVLIQKIMSKAKNFEKKNGFLTGKRQYYRDLAYNAKTVQEVEAINPNFKE